MHNRSSGDDKVLGTLACLLAGRVCRGLHLVIGLLLACLPACLPAFLPARARSLPCAISAHRAFLRARRALIAHKNAALRALKFEKRAHAQ